MGLNMGLDTGTDILLPEDPINLFLAVPIGLEDVAAFRLPDSLVKVASDITYRTGSGYITMAIPTKPIPCSSTRKTEIIVALKELVLRPPLCIFSAHISIGFVDVPRSTFESGQSLLAHALSGFNQSDQPTAESTTGMAPQESFSESKTISTEGVVKKGGGASELSTIRAAALDVQSLGWHNALAVFQLALSFCNGLTPPSESLKVFMPGQQDKPIRFRASFDRGAIQHKGVRSQDLAAGLGNLTGQMFPLWKVDLTEYDIEVVGRWIQGDEPVHTKTSSLGSLSDAADSLPGDSNKRPRMQPVMAETLGPMEMQIGFTLPLALAACPYRRRPLDGRTSLKIEIAYNLLALAGPKPGGIVMDTCSGVGTIPILGAIHYPDSLFVGIEIVPQNIERAATNAATMKQTAEEARVRTGLPSLKALRPTHSAPSLFLGDSRAICWRSATIDLILSDLPWGQRENSHKHNAKLYPRLVKEIVRLLAVGGRAVLITGERKLLQRQLDSGFAKPFLSVIQKREITIGFKVVVFELLRI